MSSIAWMLFAVGSLAAVAGAVFLYRRAETPGRGRGLLTMLRAATLVVLLLLLFDPELPSLNAAGGGRATRVLLDASLSMGLPDGREPRWTDAVRQARRLARDGEILLFGDRVRPVAPDSLPDGSPGDVRSELLPALQAVAEAGVSRVVVLTDGAVDDAAAVSRWAPRLGLDVEYRVLGDEVADRALAEVEAPGWAHAGQPLQLRYGVAARGSAGEPIAVEVLQGGVVVGTDTIVAPEAGRVSGGTISVDATAPEGGGLVRYDVRIEGGDVAPDDDERSAYVYVSEDPAGVALVSFQPDWEPRFLQPVLAQALGVPVGGYMRAGPRDWVRIGAGAEAGEKIDEAAVRSAVERADLLVLHGVGGDAGAAGWLEAAVGRARPLLVFPAGSATGVPLPLDLARPVEDDWYVSADVPATPIAGMLAGLPLEQVPPLQSVHLTAIPDGAWAPLVARRGRRGAPQPVALAGESEGRRWVAVLAQGYWRWAFRQGEPREAYNRLFSALSGWLMETRSGAGGEPALPMDRVVARGEPVRWLTPGFDTDSVRVRLTGQDGAVVQDTVVASAPDTASTGVVAPGHYEYSIFPPEDSAAAATGALTVERYSAEYASARAPLEAMRGAVPVGRGPRSGPGRPLHATAWPYILVVLLVATEWVLRRRWGLR